MTEGVFFCLRGGGVSENWDACVKESSRGPHVSGTQNSELPCSLPEAP